MRAIIATIAMLLIAGATTGFVVVGSEPSMETYGLHTDEDPGAAMLFDDDVFVSGLTEIPLDKLPASTETLTITASWRDSIRDVYDGMLLSVRTAANQSLVPVGPIRAGVPIEVAVSDLTVDRPTQRVSAWSVVLEPQAETGRAIFGNPVKVQVVAEGDAVRSFGPGGRAHETILEGHAVVAGVHGTAHNPTGWMHAPALRVEHVVPEGTIIRGDVTVEMELNAHPHVLGGFRLGILDASSHQWTWIEPTSSEGRFLRWDIPVDAASADAPEIPTSQWRFIVETTSNAGSNGPVPFEAGWVAANYGIAIMQ